MKTLDTIQIDCANHAAIVKYRYKAYDAWAFVTIDDDKKFTARIDGIDYPLKAKHIAEAAWAARVQLVKNAWIANANTKGTK
jgi:hypothetical protein